MTSTNIYMSSDNNLKPDSVFSTLGTYLTPTKNFQQYYLQPENIYIESESEQQRNEDSFVLKSAPLSMDSMLLPPIDSVRPKLDAGFINSDKSFTDSGSKSIINPAEFYLKGANLDKIPPSKCRLTNCNGPFPNDLDFSLQQPSTSDQRSALNNNSACHSTFVPMNSCVDERGYTMGMVNFSNFFKILICFLKMKLSN